MSRKVPAFYCKAAGVMLLVEKMSNANNLTNLYADPLLPIAEAMALLGIRHRSTITRQIRAGKINAVRIGRCYKIRASEVLKLAEGKLSRCLELAPYAAINSSR